MNRPALTALGSFCLILALSGATLVDAPVADAAAKGDVGAVRSLIEQGADVNAAQGDGMTALHWASERGDEEILELLVEAGADVSVGTRLGAYTPLHLASRRGHHNVVRMLLEAGSDPNAAAEHSGVTALHLAAGAHGGEKAVSELLRRGAHVNALESSAGQTALMFAASYNRVPSIKILLESGADPSVSTEVVDVLRSLTADRMASDLLRETLASYREAEGGDRSWEPSPAQVQEAIRIQREFLESEAETLEYDPEDLIAVRTDFPGGPGIRRPPFRETLVGKTGGMTALLHAAREGHLEAASALLHGGADINQVSGDNTSPLLMATLNGQFDLAMMLVERGADPNLATSTEGTSPIFATLQTQWAPKSNFPQPRAQDYQSVEYLELLATLLEAGAEPNVALKTDLWYWDFQLDKMGVDLTGATPFWRAAFAQDLEAMRMLVAYGADPHEPTRVPALGMRERRQLDGRQQEDSGLPPVPEGTPNAYPIHVAAAGAYTGLGAFAVRAVPNGFMPAVKYLVEELGADVNAYGWWGYTPLHYAATRGDNEMIAYLVEKGADVTAITRLGQSTADMARGGMGGFFQRYAFPETVELLESLGSTLECLNVHFRDTGDVCPGAGSQESTPIDYDPYLFGPANVQAPPKQPPPPGL